MQALSSEISISLLMFEGAILAHAAISALRLERLPENSGRSGGTTLALIATHYLLSPADINTPACLEFRTLIVTG